MRLLVAAVGRLKDGAERELLDRYVTRLEASGRSLGLGPLRIEEILEGRAAPRAARLADEAERLSRVCADADLRVALDERGRTTTSEAFARWIAEERDRGVRTLAFLIGGPDGHGPGIREGAGRVLSLGPMTLPHGLARIILAEQLYRAATILSGHPYHRA